MTAQISDIFRLREHDYDLAGISIGGELLDPAALGLDPSGPCSACWRGYQAVFGLAGDQLVLVDLLVTLLRPGEPGPERQEGPPIHGVAPDRVSRSSMGFNNRYQEVGLPIDYTGGLLLADRFIRGLYLHMGFHPAWKYEKVIELIFEAGVLREERDRSDWSARLRKKAQELLEGTGPRPTPAFGESIEFIKRAFDRRYRLE